MVRANLPNLVPELILKCIMIWNFLISLLNTCNPSEQERVSLYIEKSGGIIFKKLTSEIQGSCDIASAGAAFLC